MQPFCSILLTADFPDDRSGSVVSDHIRDLCRPYAVEVRLTEPAAESGILTPPTVKYVLTVRGSDKPGMLRLLATKMAELGVDIRNLYAERCERDQTFVMELELAIPLALNFERVGEQISTRCQELGLQMTLEPFAEFFARCGGNLRDSVRATTRA
jgi:glycine cleavage system transcriptional repressor